ncbi:MAG: hypothetical protein ACTSR8_05535 [Promethearchaeota archaeon]
MVKKVSIICPVCSKSGNIEIDENILNKSSRGITAINLPVGLICDHSFIAYIDKNFEVRDCFLTDFAIDLPQIEATGEEKELFNLKQIDVDLIKESIPALTLTYLIRSFLYKKPVLFLYTNEFLYEHLEKFFKEIIPEEFKMEVFLEIYNFYKRNKKQFKDHVVLDAHSIIKDKAKILDSKKISIERVIVQKFLAEYDAKSSLIIMRNEIQKAFKLAKEIADFMERIDKSKDLLPKHVSNYLKEKYDQEISDIYLKFLIGIVQNYFKVNFTKYLDFNSMVEWTWFLK